MRWDFIKTKVDGIPGVYKSKRFLLNETLVGYAGDIGLVYYRMYLYSGDATYLTAALNVANTLAREIRTGTATQSVWPDRVLMDTGKVTPEYGAHWVGCYMLLDQLIKANRGDVKAYEDARGKAREFLLQYPVKTCYWADGHTDNSDYSATYKSNTPTATQRPGTEYLRLAFRPARITLAGARLPLRFDLDAEGCTLRRIGEEEYAVNIRRTEVGHVVSQ